MTLRVRVSQRLTQTRKFPNRDRLTARMGHSQSVNPTAWRIPWRHLPNLRNSQRHRMLNDELAEALQHPSVDDSTLAELKRRKLKLKDEMARLTQMEHDSVVSHSQERPTDGLDDEPGTR
jgi:hypothetical protein